MPEAAMLESQEYECPYCGESVEALLDLSGGDQQYIEDCPVCCRPIVFDLQVDDEGWKLHVRSENE
jgi:Cysteine-rich CPXCG